MVKPELLTPVPSGCADVCPIEAIREIVSGMDESDIIALENKFKVATEEGADDGFLLLRLVEQEFSKSTYACSGPKLVENQPPVGVVEIVCPRMLIAKQAVYSAINQRAVMNGGYATDKAKPNTGNYL